MTALARTRSETPRARGAEAAPRRATRSPARSPRPPRPGARRGRRRMTEAELQSAIINLCDTQEPPLPWIHIGDSRRADAGGPWRQGFPDMLIVGQHRAIIRELKGDGGELLQRQNVWLTWLAPAGLDADEWT